MYNESIAKFDEAMKLYRARRYKEAEKILLEMLDTKRENKYALFQMGKIRLQFRDTKGAEAYFKECIKYFPQNVYPRLELGKLYANQGKEQEAEAEFKKYIEIDRDRSPHAKLELGRLYVAQGKEQEAEAEFKHYIEIDRDRTPHARLELGRLYAAQGKEQEAEAEFKRYIEIDRDRTPHARLELGRLYAKQGNDEKAKTAYGYILENLEQEYSVDNRITHIKKHMQNDLSKSKHGVFVKDCIEIMNTILRNKGKRQIGCICDIYCTYVPNCGYEGGKNGDGHILNYVTIVTLPNSNQLITMFPSDEIMIGKNELAIRKPTVQDEER